MKKQEQRKEEERNKQGEGRRESTTKREKVRNKEEKTVTFSVTPPSRSSCRQAAWRRKAASCKTEKELWLSEITKRAGLHKQVFTRVLPVSKFIKKLINGSKQKISKAKKRR
jgi:hypothetical protein